MFSMRWHTLLLLFNTLVTFFVWICEAKLVYLVEKWHKCVFLTWTHGGAETQQCVIVTFIVSKPAKYTLMMLKQTRGWFEVKSYFYELLTHSRWATLGVSKCTYIMYVCVSVCYLHYNLILTPKWLFLPCLIWGGMSSPDIIYNDTRICLF